MIEQAEGLGIDPGKVLAWLASGELVGIDVAERRGKKRHWRISDDDLRDDMRRRRSHPPAPAQPQTRRRNPVKEYV